MTAWVRPRAIPVLVTMLCGVVATFGTPTAARAQGLQVSAQPALYPAFDPAVPDYVTRCSSSNAVNMTVSAPPGTTVDVDGQGPRSGDFTTAVSIDPGEEFQITAAGGGSTTYYVRCLPRDFPNWTFQRPGQPQAEWYTVAPFARTDLQPVPPEAGISLSYAAMFDGNGVPVWWIKTPFTGTDFKLLPDGNVAWTSSQSNAEEHRLDGSLVRVVTPVDAQTDPHEIMLLPNGDYVTTAARTITGASPCGGASAPIYDTGAEEIAPNGSVVWTWWGSDHIGISEVPSNWCQAQTASGAYDPYHINSIEPDGDGFIMSFRHLDAIYRVNKADGHVVWKLGGVTRPESLTILNDPLSAVGDTFRGQHDARVLQDGTVTVHDNGFHPTAQRPPRAVRFVIDSVAATARLVEQKNDPDSDATPLCCGSARRLDGGDWVMSWGSTGLITELSPSGSRVFRLTFDENSLFSYRVHPVPFGKVSRTALRAGMDAQFPRGYARPRGAPSVNVPLVPAFRQCGAPDRTHGAPLAFASCASPAQESPSLTVGTPDSNGARVQSVGSVVYKANLGNSATPENEADIGISVSVSDVRHMSDLSDYTGQLQLQGAIRVTDRDNGTLENEAATGVDTEFPVRVPCAGTVSDTVGSTCSLLSTVNAIVPGAVLEGKRATWQLGQVEVYDGGPSEVAGGSHARPFLRQGLFAP